jgi:hypothetical protein
MQVEIDSKLIESVSYDEATRRLRLYLTNGAKREFIDVPQDVVDGLIGASSAGRFYFSSIRHKYNMA